MMIFVWVYVRSYLYIFVRSVYRKGVEEYIFKGGIILEWVGGGEGEFLFFVFYIDIL